jgi:hypothetical protein
MIFILDNKSSARPTPMKGITCAKCGESIQVTIEEAIKVYRWSLYQDKHTDPYVPHYCCSECRANLVQYSNSE